MPMRVWWVGVGEKETFEIMTWRLLTLLACHFPETGLWKQALRGLSQELSSWRSCLDSGFSKGPGTTTKDLEPGLCPCRLVESSNPDLSSSHSSTAFWGSWGSVYILRIATTETSGHQWTTILLVSLSPSWIPQRGYRYWGEGCDPEGGSKWSEMRKFWIP